MSLKILTRVWRDNRETDRLSLYRGGMRAQRSTVLCWFCVIKRCGYRETNNFLFLVPSPIIILGHRLLLIPRKVLFYFLFYLQVSRDNS